MLRGLLLTEEAFFERCQCSNSGTTLYIFLEGKIKIISCYPSVVCANSTSLLYSQYSLYLFLKKSSLSREEGLNGEFGISSSKIFCAGNCRNGTQIKLSVENVSYAFPGLEETNVAVWFYLKKTP